MSRTARRGIDCVWKPLGEALGGAIVDDAIRNRYNRNKNGPENSNCRGDGQYGRVTPQPGTGRFHSDTACALHHRIRMKTDQTRDQYRP